MQTSDITLADFREIRKKDGIIMSFILINNGL